MVLFIDCKGRGMVRLREGACSERGRNVDAISSNDHICVSKARYIYQPDAQRPASMIFVGSKNANVPRPHLQS